MARVELKGQIGAQGVALGKARLVFPMRYDIETEVLEPSEINDELVHLEHAIIAARDELKRLHHRVTGELAQEISEFIDAHRLILEDPHFIEAIAKRIQHGYQRATAALKSHRDELTAAFAAIDDPYLRSRGEDIDHVVSRVYAALKTRKTEQKAYSARKNIVLVCETVAPTELDYWREHGVVAMVTTQGSVFSHTAILARAFGIPLLCGVGNALEQVQEDDTLLVDAERGRVIISPTAKDQNTLRLYQRAHAASERRRAKLRDTQTQTKDGVAIQLWVNTEHVDEITEAYHMGAAGVGLYRTEFLFLKHHEIPDEDEQFRAYRDAVIAMRGKPVTLRTLDIGADKKGMGILQIEGEPNPALGLRGIRLMLARMEPFCVQLRAMLRAAAYGPVRILLPMISRCDEVSAVELLLAECREQLIKRGLDVGGEVLLGSMIEVPAAALMSAELAKNSDFLAIGSNDLVQYTLAADRNNTLMSSYYDPWHPAVIRLLAFSVEQARKHKKPISLCGELAADSRFLPVLLALGLTEFSVHPRTLLAVRENLLALSYAALRKRTASLLELGSHEEFVQVFHK